MLTASAHSSYPQVQPESTVVRDRVSLSQWLNHITEPQWQDVLNISKRVAIATRSSIKNDEIISTIDTLRFSDHGTRRNQLIQKLGLIADGDRDAIQTLIKLIQTTENDETLWIAVDSLRQAAPAHPSAGVRRSRSIDLCYPVNFNFIVSIVPKIENRVDILLQVYPDASRRHLPSNLKLILQDESGNSLREVVAVDTDCCIQLKLSGKYREIFSVCLELDGIVSIVDFVV
jgi:Protein of unknown function (DUF1822)